MLDRVQVRALAGPLKDIQRLVPQPLLRCLGCVLKVVLSCWKVNLCPSLRFSSRISLYFSLFIFPSILTCLHRLLSLAGRPALGRVLVVPNFLHFKNDGGHCVLGTFNAADFFWDPFSDLCLDTILSRSSMDNSFNLTAWFLL